LDSIKLGDANVDKKIDIRDVIHIKNYLIGNEKLICPISADVNLDGKVTGADRDYLNDYLFKGGPAPGKADSTSTPKLTPKKVLEVKDIGEVEIPKLDKEKTLNNIREFEEKRKLGFSESWSGTGHISNGEEGYLVSAFWAIQKFADYDKETKVFNTEITEKASGNLKIVNSGNYHLTLVERDADSFTFNVALNSAKNRIGTLELNMNSELSGITIWSGTLDFKEGELSGTWNIVLATSNHVIKPAESISSDDSIETIPICKSLRGDTNADGNVDISDAIYIKNYLNDDKPLLCKENTDVNSDGEINQADMEYLLDYLFKGGKKPKQIATLTVATKTDKCSSIQIGDANTDGKVDISDPIYIKMYLQGDKKLVCPSSADANGDGEVTVEDRDYLLDYLFEGGSKPVTDKVLNVKAIPAKKAVGFWVRFKQFFFS